METVLALLAIFVLAVGWGTCFFRLRAATKREQTVRGQLLQLCQLLILERGGGDERARKVAHDFCRYNPPDYVVACMLDEREPPRP